MELEGTKRHLKLATCEKWTLTNGGVRDSLGRTAIITSIAKVAKYCARPWVTLTE